MSLLRRDDKAEEQNRVFHALQNFKTFVQVQLSMRLGKF